MAKSKAAQEYRKQSIQQLLDILKPGDVVLTNVNHVSQSGMSRDISCYVVRDNEVRDISWLVASAIDYPLAKNKGIRVGGCGMDMGFHVVYSLGRALWPEGTAEPHGTRNGNPDTCGGYALKQRWL